MPPKKRLRGPQIPPDNEERMSEDEADLVNPSDDFENEYEIPEDANVDSPDIAEDEERRLLPDSDSEDDTDDVPSDPNSFDLLRKNRIHIFPSKCTKTEAQMRSMAKNIRSSVNGAIRSMFQSRDKIKESMKDSAQKLGAAYKKAELNRNKNPDMVRVFLNEVEIRLNMMMEDTSVGENRGHVFKLVSVVAVDLMSSTDSKDDEFFRFLLEYIGIWSKDENVACRINSTCIAAYLLEAGMVKLPKGVPDTFCGFSSEYSAKLYMFLAQAFSDKESSARIPGIKGMGIIQKLGVPSSWPPEARERSPKDFILRSCRDVSADCRVTAIKCANISEELDNILVDVIQFDKSLTVRVAALSQLAKTRPSRLTYRKMNVIANALKDHDAAVREAAKGTLRDWIIVISNKCNAAYQRKKGGDDPDIQEIHEENDEAKRAKGYFVGCQALFLLWLTDLPETVEQHAYLRRIAHHAFDVLRQMYICQPDPSNTFAEIVIQDIKEFKPTENLVPAITKSSIGSILMDSDVDTSVDVSSNRAMILYWRCAIEFLVEKSRSEADKINALARFLSPLKVMCEHMERILGSLKNEEQYQIAEDEGRLLYTLQMSIVENMIAVFKHAQREHSGIDAYKKLLLSMLMNPFYQKKVFDVIIQELVQYYSKDRVGELFELVHSKANEMRHHYNDGKFPILMNSVHVGEQKFIRDWRSEEELNQIPVKDQAMALIDVYELKVINSLIKTGCLPEWDDSYQQKYIPMLRRHFASSDLDARVLATECIGMIGTEKLEWVDKEVEKMFQNLKTEEEPVHAAIVTVLTDIYINFKAQLNEITKVVDRNEDFSQYLAHVIINTIDEDEPEKLFRCVEAMVKILLNCKMDVDDKKMEEALLAIMYRSVFAITTIPGSKIRSTLVVFLKFFCSINIDNQTLLIRAWPRFFKMWAHSTTPYLLGPPHELLQRLKRSAAFFIALTRHTNLGTVTQQKYRPVHLQLVRTAIQEITTSSANADSYANALAFIDYSNFTRDEQTKIHLDMMDCIELCDEPKSRIAEVKKATRKLSKMLGIDENEENPDEVASQASTSRTESRSTRLGRYGSNQSIASGRGGVRGRGIDEPMEAIEEEGEDYPSSSTSKPAPQKGGRRLIRQEYNDIVSRGSATPSTRKKSDEDPAALLNSPERTVIKKPPSRPTTATRRAPTPQSSASNRTTPLRSSARRLQK